MITNIENTTKSVSDEKEKEAKEKKKKNIIRSAPQKSDPGRFSERTRKHGVFAFILITKDGPFRYFPHYIFTLYTAPVVLLERRLTEEDDEEVAEGESVRVSSLFVFSLKACPFFAFVKSGNT